MEENFDALEVIAHTRGKVDLDDVPTGGNLFPLWGWLAAIVYLLEFFLWRLYGQEWCMWLWVAIPVIGTPLMSVFVRKDHQRAHRRTRESKFILNFWILAACCFGIGGFLFGFTGVYEMVENPLICLLIGLGAFITGSTARFLPMIVGGIIGVVIGIVAFTLQGDIWYWQMLAVAAAAVSALVVPGHIYQAKVKNGI